MNSSKNQPKFSKIEKATNKYIILGIAIQTISCLIAAVIEAFYIKFNEWSGIHQDYLELQYSYDFTGTPPYHKITNEDYSDLSSSLQNVPVNFFAWFLAM